MSNLRKFLIQKESNTYPLPGWDRCQSAALVALRWEQLLLEESLQRREEMKRKAGTATIEQILRFKSIMKDLMKKHT